MALLGALVGGVAGAGGSMASSGLQYAFQVKLMKRQHAFNIMYRSTQYQATMKDMRAAGLNPMLAAGFGGGGSPPGAAGSVGRGEIGASAKQGAMMGAEIQKIRTSERLIAQQFQSEKNNTAYANARAKLEAYKLEAARLGISGHVLEDQINRGAITGPLRKAGKLLGPILSPLTSAVGAYFGAGARGAIGRRTPTTGKAVRMGK